MEKVVARYADGRIVKGTTTEFVPEKGSLFVDEAGTPPGTEPVKVVIAELKALFFVKDLIGNPDYVERKEFDPSRPIDGIKVRVEFKDGEVLIGAATDYSSERSGFFLVPADPGANTERCYVVMAAAERVDPI